MRSRRNVLRTMAGATALGLSSGCLGGISGNGRTVQFGAVFPLSGPLERVGTHGLRTTQQAVADINEAGGIDGREIELTEIDSEASADTAVEKYRALDTDSLVGLVGGLVSDVSIALSQEVAADGVMEVSPASTAPQLTNAGRSDDRKFFGRTVPSDGLQAAAMAKVVDDPLYIGAESVALLSIDNSFGAGLAQAQTEYLDTEVVADVRYDPSSNSFSKTLASVFENDPEAVAFTSVSGQETDILDAYAQSEHGVPWVFSAGMFAGDIPSFYEGFYSASLSSSRTSGYFELVRRLSDIDSLASFAANAYDAMFLMAAAAQQAGEVSGSAIADTIQYVSGGTGHTVSVGDFDRVRSLTDAGRSLNFQGASGAVDLTEDLEPLSSYLIQRVDDGAVSSLELLQTQFFESGGDR